MESIGKTKKKRGRPATGRDPLVTVRIPADLIAYIDQRASKAQMSRSELIRIMLEESSIDLPPGLKKKTRTAYHEAGHAVIARVLRIPIKKVSIQYSAATKRRGASEGHVKYTMVRHSRAWLRANIIMTMAARAAEDVLVGFKANGCDAQDIIDVAKIAASANFNAATLDRLRDMATMLVWRHSESIKRVVTLLVHSKTLKQDHVDKIIATSSRRACPADPMDYILGRRIDFDLDLVAQE